MQRQQAERSAYREGLSSPGTIMAISYMHILGQDSIIYAKFSGKT